MVGENGVPETPDWSLDRCIGHTRNDALAMPLRFDGDDG